MVSKTNERSGDGGGVTAVGESSKQPKLSAKKAAALGRPRVDGKLSFRARSDRRARSRYGSSGGRSVLNQIFVPRNTKSSSIKTRELRTNGDDGGSTGTGGGIIGDNATSNQPKKSFLYTLLSPRSSQWPARWFRNFIVIIIVADFIIFIASTEPKLQRREHLQFFERVEGIVASIFFIEYILRLFTVTESKRYSRLGPFWGRLSYVTTWGAIVDFVSAFPYFIEQVSGLDFPHMTMLRTLRLLRILKTNGFVRAIDAVGRVVYFNREILFVALFIGLYLILLTSLLMYYMRPDESEEFQSILATMYLATLMLTGQGGPEGEMPWYTKGVVLLTGVFSIGMFAIPASMLTWGFEAEAERVAKRTRQLSKIRRNLSAHDLNDSDSWSSSGNDYSADEAYQKILAGEDDTDDDSNDADSAAIAKFLQLDADGSGSISLQEFIQFVRKESGLSTGNGTTSVESASETGSGNTTLSKRIDVLETKVDNIMKKVEKICNLMEENSNQPKKKWVF